MILLVALTAAAVLPAHLYGSEDLHWIEDFSSDPIATGRMAIPRGHDPSRFIYDSQAAALTVHYDTFEPTAWCVRALDPDHGRVLGRYDDFEFRVVFQIRSEGYQTVTTDYAQIGWALLNMQTTGPDRAGGSGGPYAYDVVCFDYFPNISPLFGGPTLSPTIIHTQSPGTGFFTSVEFTAGAETRIDVAQGDATIVLDAVHTVYLDYRGQSQTATLRIERDGVLLPINAAGAGGPGGFDGVPTTIQTHVLQDRPFAVDHLALTAWQDTFNPFGSTVVADVDVYEIEFFAPAVLLGDVNLDGLVNGSDIRPFIELCFNTSPDVSLAARGDFTGDGAVDSSDLPGFIGVLIGTPALP